MESERRAVLPLTVREAAGLDQNALNVIIKSMFFISMNGGKRATPGRVALVRKAGQDIANAVAAAGSGLTARPPYQPPSDDTELFA